MDSNALSDASTSPPRQPTPVLSLRDVVVFPHMVIPLFVGRERSVRALEETMNVDKQILLITQRNPEVESPEPDDLFDCGTIASILQMLRLPDGTTKVLVEGVDRVRINSLEDTEGYLAGHWEYLKGADDDDRSVEVTTRSLMGLF